LCAAIVPGNGGWEKKEVKIKLNASLFQLWFEFLPLSFYPYLFLSATKTLSTYSKREEKKGSLDENILSIKGR
jgi:hypothetical protein